MPLFLLSIFIIFGLNLKRAPNFIKALGRGYFKMNMINGYVYEMVEFSGSDGGLAIYAEDLLESINECGLP